ncbi:MAG: Lipopolysaccharide core heptosyltransferase RfaQ [Syntrophus sp. SKADARSKE-3]|nr:Lipopolysaccharide core heptosyltransferase RfaQ [Syntrophus sp. SKADARSKE-3]
MMIREQFQIAATIRRILIIQLGDIGDVVWTVPTLISLHKAYQSAKVSILVREGSGALLSAEPYIDKIFEVPSPAGGFFAAAAEQVRFLHRLQNESFDLVVDLRSGDRGAFLSRLTGAPIRGALLHQDASFWRNHAFTHLVRPINEGIRTAYGAAEQSLRIIRGLGISTTTDAPALHVSSQAAALARKILHRLDLAWDQESVLKKTMITLNPFSRWPYKEWDLERWVSVMEGLAAEFGVKTVIIGSGSERPMAEAIVRRLPGRVFQVAGETSLDVLAALLSFSRLHMGVDSAAIHIAAAVGTPTVTIYGPSDWRDWAPVGECHRVVVSDMDCVPCHQKGCRGEGRSLCLEKVSPEDVLSAVRALWTLPLQ